MKTCGFKDCNQVNPQKLDAFHKEAANKDGFSRYCKHCKNIRSTKWYAKNKEYVADKNLYLRYKLSKEDKARMLEAQNNQCLIGKEQLTLKTAQVDHCHKTGKVRGLLCLNCNKQLGVIEKPGFLESALRYIGKHS